MQDLLRAVEEVYHARTIHADRSCVERAYRGVFAECDVDRENVQIRCSQHSADIRTTSSACRERRWSDPRYGHARRSAVRRLAADHLRASESLMQHYSILVPNVTAVGAAAVDPTGGCDRHCRAGTVALWAHLADPRKDILRTQRLIHVAPPGLFCEGANIPESIQEGQGSVEPSLSRRCQGLVWPRIRRATPGASSCPTVSNHSVTPFDRPRESFVGRHLRG